MADEFATVELEGLRELEAALVRMGERAGFKALRQALMFATTPMVKRARQNATAVKDSGALAQAMGRTTRRGTARGQADPNRAATLYLGPKKKDKKALALWNAAHPNQSTPATWLRHAHLVEFGGGTIQAPIAPLRRAADATVNESLKRFRRKLSDLIAKAADR